MATQLGVFPITHQIIANHEHGIGHRRFLDGRSGCICACWPGVGRGTQKYVWRNSTEGSARHGKNKLDTLCGGINSSASQSTKFAF